MANSKNEKTNNESTKYLAITLVAVIVAGIFALLYITELNYISGLQSQVSGGASVNGGSNLQSQISQLQTEVSNLQSQNNQLTTQISQQQSLLSLQVSTAEANQQTINQGASTETAIANFNAQYAGYIIVSGTSTVNGYIDVNGVDYSINGNGFNVKIPVLPGTVTVSYGNNNAFGGVSATVSVVYYS